MTKITYLLQRIRAQVGNIDAGVEALKLNEARLRATLREQIVKQGLDFRIVSGRMGCKVHDLTNFFCNGQNLKAGKLDALREAIKTPATSKELNGRKRAPCWKRAA